MFSLLPLLSQALLWPVILLLLSGVAISVAMCGGLLGEYLRRRRWYHQRAALLQNFIANREAKPSQEHLAATFRQCGLNPEVLQGNPDFDKLLDDYQLRMQRRLARVNLYVRIGPMLGLAGTLIPLGPGLMALSSGNVNALSDQLVIAFTSTVLGLFVGAVCFTIHLVRRHWYAKDLSDLEFLLQRWQA